VIEQRRLTDGDRVPRDARKRGVSLEGSVEAHRAVFEAVSARDAEGAAAAMERHLNDALVDLLATTAGD
jgi:DNA-binding GntR family transcriptional regulator